MPLGAPRLVKDLSLSYLAENKATTFNNSYFWNGKQVVVADITVVVVLVINCSADD